MTASAGNCPCKCSSAGAPAEAHKAQQPDSVWGARVYGIQLTSGAGASHARGSTSDSPSLRADHSGVSSLARQVKAGSAQAQGRAGGVDFSCWQTYSIPSIQSAQSSPRTP